MARTELKRNVEGSSKKPTTPPRAFRDIMPRGGAAPLPKVEHDPASSPFFRTPKVTVSPRIDSGDGEVKTFAHQASTGGSKKRTYALLGVVGVVAVVVVGLFFILPNATVAVTLKETTLPFSVNVSISTATVETKVTDSLASVPGELFAVKRNADVPVSATTTSRVEVKASGKLTVVNAYGTSPQVLVATTRFTSPEGKVFRLVNKVSVPGASKSGSSTVPASIEVSVVADQAGESYNVPTSKGWKIPGFSGTPRYEKIYAESQSEMTGGFIGERAVAGAPDLERGKGQLKEILNGSAESELAVLMKDSFKLFPEAKSFTLGAVDVRPDPSDKNSFRLFGDGVLRAVTFDEQELVGAISLHLKPNGGVNLVLATSSISYGKPTVDLSRGTVSVTATGTVTFRESFDTEAFRTKVLGLREDNLRKAVSAIPGVERASVALDPFWVTSVPENAGRVTVTVE